MKSKWLQRVVVAYDRESFDHYGSKFCLIRERGYPNFHSIICQVVAYRRLKKQQKISNFSSKSGRGRLQEVVAYKRFQI